MRKPILLIATLLSSLLLTACGGAKPSESSEEGGGESNSSESEPAGPKKTLIYRSWDYGTEAQNNEERRLIKAFEEKEKNVTIKVVENPGSGNSYWDAIDASVINGIDLADVFMTPNLDWPLRSQYILNIKQYADADEEFARVPASVRDACTFKSGIYALPARMNLQGYFANTKLIESKLNIRTNRLDCYSEFSEIERIIDAAASKDDVVGLDSPTHFIDTMASVLDDTGEMGYFTWDGEQYHLDSPAFITGVQKARQLFDEKKTLDAYNEDDRDALGLDPEEGPKEDAWNKGKLALRYGYTYEMPDMVEHNTTDQVYKFIGNPGGKITIVGDYYCIYKETKEPELAYKFAKWMSFGMEGFAKRMELYGEKGTINTLPLTDDETLIANYFETFGNEIEGLEEAFEYIQDKSMVEGVKVVPGFLQARQNKQTGIKIGYGDAVVENATMFELLNACVVFGLDIADYATGENSIDAIADATYTRWMNTYGVNYD